MHTQSLQSCLILCDPMVHSPPDSSVHRILQARILEWVAMPPPPGDLPDLGIKPTSPASLALQADSLPLSHLANPILCHYLPINIPSLILYYKNFYTTTLLLKVFQLWITVIPVIPWNPHLFNHTIYICWNLDNFESAHPLLFTICPSHTCLKLLFFLRRL